VAIAAGVIEQRAFPARVACQRKAAEGGGAALGDVMADLPLVRTQGTRRGHVVQAGMHEHLQ
jgi:hypothetical protein